MDDIIVKVRNIFSDLFKQDPASKNAVSKEEILHASQVLIITISNGSVAPRDMLKWAVVSRALFNAARPVISSSLNFWWTESPLVMYKPQRLRHVEQITNLPPNLTHLTFHTCFNINVDHLLPSTLTHLTFGAMFTNPVDHLPPSLTHLTFGFNFNQKVDTLPHSLTHLTFAEHFNQPVDCLPHSLTHITFGEQFNHPVDCLPPSLVHITFGESFNQSISKLPESVTYLYLSRFFNHAITALPPLLTHLTLATTYEFKHAIDVFPNSITHLTLCDDYNGQVHVLPSRLKQLTILGDRYPLSLTADVSKIKVRHLKNPYIGLYEGM